MTNGISSVGTQLPKVMGLETCYTCTFYINSFTYIMKAWSQVEFHAALSSFASSLLYS